MTYTTKTYIMVNGRFPRETLDDPQVTDEADFCTYSKKGKKHELDLNSQRFVELQKTITRAVKPE